MSSPSRRLRRARERQRRSAPSALVAYEPQAFAPQDALLAAARAQGCTCDPDVQLHAGHQAVLLHDDWCALMRAQDTN